ncbi:MAG: hypothetical protein EU532_06830 [Promethearchaeota archaeon]|nr:MAG: hypothetical protein EU532_06830 [Candidatus Lokiarchaeota archaeon]
MEAVNLKIFKLNYSGNFDEIKSENVLELFSLVNVLAVYVPMQKRMYIWIGKNATQGLKKHIAQTRALFSTQKEFSDLKILRNITIESGSEPSDFFQFIGFSWEDLKAHIKKQEESQAPIIKKISSLQSKQTKLIDTEKYDEAIKISEQIIELAKQINDEALETEQQDIITNLKEKSEIKTDLDKIREEIRSIENKFESLVETKIPQNIISAHQIIEEFKKKYEGSFDLSSISESYELLKREEIIWSNFTKERNYATKELEKLKQKLQKSLEKHQIIEAEQIIKKAKEHLLIIVEDEIKKDWIRIETAFLEKKIKSETLEKIEKSIKESSKLKDNYEFEEALKKINSTIEIIQDKEILEYNKRLEELKEELVQAEREYSNINNVIIELENQLNENRKKNHLKAALTNCEKIIELSEIIKNPDTTLTYTQILEELKDEIQQKESEIHSEQILLTQKAKELEKMINIDDDVLPLVEEFTATEILGDLSDDVNEVLEEVGKLLNDYRVEIKEDILSKAIIKTASGKAVELERDFNIEQTQEKENEIKIGVQSGLLNPFEDIIEEAIITDLIPYNYEITEIHLNGEPIKELPNKSLNREGLELEWKFQNIPPKEMVDINYDLRRRVSRTVIFILKGKLKIVKTHANLNTLELEGLYEATLPFTNSFGIIINGVIVEDIIPLYYLHFIKEPLNLLPAKISNSEHGELIKWNIGDMAPKTINYQYRLLELYRLEEIKININILSKTGIDALNNGDLSEALEIYDKIINQLEEYNK